MITTTTHASLAGHLNRRGCVRLFEPRGMALCRAGKSQDQYRIKDASRGGIALMGGPSLDLGTSVVLKIRWPMIGEASAHGVVCRQAPDQSTLAVRYTEVNGMIDLVERLNRVDRMRRHEPLAMFCGSNDEIRSTMEELDDVGFQYVSVKRPIGALWILQNPWKPVMTIVLPPESHWLVFSGLVGRDYPNVRRLLVDGTLSSSGAELAMEHEIVDDTLRGACEPNGLYAGLGLRLSDEQCLSCRGPLPSTRTPFCAGCLDRSTDLGICDDLGGGD